MAQKVSLNLSDVTIVDGAEELSQASGLGIEEAIALVDVVETRAGNRTDNRRDLIVVLEEWMMDFWNRDFSKTIETPYLLAVDVEDYSAKSYLINGGYHVNAKGLEMDSSITKSVDILDHGTAEYPKDKGTTWVAKSGVAAVYSLKQ